MLWTPWPTSVATILFVCAILAWWFVEPKTRHLNVIVVLGCVLFYWAIAPDLARSTPARTYRLVTDFSIFFRLDVLVLHHTNMLVTGVAFVWLAHRAVQTLRKSVSELINTLAVDVPEAPDVGLGGIHADAATLHWTRPLPTRPVSKFTIQVNGVNVGESGSQETAITVTGLKADHYYNVRVIAVGSNNFQAGSRLIRLRTYGLDGCPQLGDGRLPSNFVPEEHPPGIPRDTIDDEDTARNTAAGVEVASTPEAPTVPTRESTSTTNLGRRSTITRKHSLSTASLDPPNKDDLADQSEQTLEELSNRFNSIRQESDDIQAQITKDELEHDKQVRKLAEEKQTLRRIQKDKDDTTKKLKDEAGSTERAMRSAQQRKTQKEKLVRDREAEHRKLEDDMTKWDKDVESMCNEQVDFEKKKKEHQQKADAREQQLRTEISLAKDSLAKEEEDLKYKSGELKEAEEQRKSLPGGEESEELQELNRQWGRDFELRRSQLQRSLSTLGRKLRMATNYQNVLQSQLAAAQQSGLPFANSQANSSGVDFDLGTQNQIKRRSRNSNSLTNVAVPSPASSYSMADRSIGSSMPFAPSRPPTRPPGFAPGPFRDSNIDFSGLLDEASARVLTAGAPLSPNATKFLPTDILSLLDAEPPSPSSRPSRQGTFGSAVSPNDEPQSPASSGRSFSIMSSPHNSMQHLPFSQFTGEASERMSLKGSRGEVGAASSPLAAPAQNTFRKSFIPWRQNSRPKAADEPPVLGSLKPNQSQSLPRQTDEQDPAANKRRISLSSPFHHVFNRNSAGPELLDANGLSHRGLATSRRLGAAYAHSISSNIFSDRDPSSPRPLSIASSELARPSTDSASIWGPTPHSRIWPTDEHPWGASRNVSRRPSLHGSPSMLKTSLADADDEILDDSAMLRASPSQVGVIGSKPIAKTLTQRLNPAAPMFKGSFLRGKPNKDKEADRDAKDKPKGKGKERESTKERKPRESFTSMSDVTSPSVADSPSDSRQSRDAYSIDTPSVTESRESLSLDQSSSNTPTDQAATSIGVKEAESGLRKLLRKGSSSKFSLSSVRGLGKKGPSSVTNSDKNASVDRSSFDDFAEDGALGVPPVGRSYDSVHSSPLIGPTSKTSAKEKPVSWGARFSMKKKPGREKESLDLEREESAPSTPVIDQR